MQSLQTILGSGGSIGIPLARELKNYTNHIRLVSRNPKKINGNDELFPADLTDASQVDQAISGSAIVYVTVGFEYRLSVWQHTWPSFMQNVIQSCLKHQAKLVFFDNLYLYARSEVPLMTETSLIHPPSRKGAVRAQIHNMLFEAMEKNNLEALIARSADFYGPDSKNGVFNIMAWNNLAKGKKAQVFGNLNSVHTYTYAPDAAKATALLGNTPDAYGQEWHVPTTKERLTQRDWINLAARTLQVEPKAMPVPLWMIRLLGIFMPVMREFPEMLYQYQQDYVFDSTKFEKRFGFGATAPEEGMLAMNNKDNYEL